MPRLNIDKATRNTLMFLAGLAGVIFETVHEQVDRPYLLAVFGTMMGLPLFVTRDERDPRDRRDDEDRDDEDQRR